MKRTDFYKLTVGDKIKAVAVDGWGGHVVENGVYEINAVEGQGMSKQVSFIGEDDFPLTLGYLLYADFQVIH